MSADWIKLRTGIWTDPRVISIASALALDIDAAVGKLGKIWAWADTHTVHGRAKNVGAAWIDTLTNCKGFAEAMRAVNWLVFDDTGLALPDFHKHNGKSAKRRALDARRKLIRRAGGQLSAEPADIPRTKRKSRERERERHNTTLLPTLPVAREAVSADEEEFSQRATEKTKTKRAPPRDWLRDNPCVARNYTRLKKIGVDHDKARELAERLSEAELAGAVGTLLEEMKRRKQERPPRVIENPPAYLLGIIAKQNGKGQA